MAVVHEVIIIGAGIAGLAAAAKLAPRFSRNDVLILEGSSRIGGRLRSEHWENADVCIERGANWVHGPSESNPIYRLAAAGGLEGHLDDRDELCHVRCAATGKAFDQQAQERSQAFDIAFEHLSQLATNETSDFGCAAGLRAGGWVPKTPLDDAIEWLKFDFEYSSDPSEASAFHNVREEHTRTDFGEDSFLITDRRGFDTLAHSLAESALAAGTQIHHDTIVSVIDASTADEDGYVTLHVAGSHGTHRAKRVIVTASVGVLQSGLIQFTPELPLPLLRDLHSIRQALYLKVFAAWPRPWWRQGLDAEGSEGVAPELGADHTLLVSQNRRGVWPLLTVVTEGDAEGDGSAAVLCATLVGQEAWAMENSTDDEVAASLHATLVSAFPSTRVPLPYAHRVCRWGTDPLFRGAYSFLPTGALPDGWQHLQAPLYSGKVWLAGEAIHERYSGYLHGAFLSGEDVATRIIASLDCIDS